MELNDVTNGNEISKNSQRIMFEDGDINISESKESDYFSNDKNDQRFPETKAQISYPGSQINIAKKNFSRFSIRQAALFQSANMNQLDKVFPDSNFAPSNPDLNMDKKPTVNHLMSEASKEGEKDEEADQDFEGMISIKFKKTFLFYQESRFRIRWDLLVMFVAVYNCFDVPYNVAFTDKNHQPLYSTILDALTNLLFILDLLINFVTTYTDKATKVEVTSYSKIAKHYLKGKFWIDLIASIPFDYIRYLDPSSNTIPFELLSLLKLVRILRLSKLITYMNIRNEVKSSLRLIKLVFFLILFLHCLGCFWFFLAKQTEKWIPPLDYVYITTTIYSESSVFQY